MDVRTRSGDIDLALPDNAKFELKMVADHGEAHNEYGSPLVVDEQERGATIAGSVGTGPELRLQSERGTITVRKASDNNAEKGEKSEKSEKPEKAEKGEKEEELKVEKQ
jgi:hypothetical protein